MEVNKNEHLHSVEYLVCIGIKNDACSYITKCFKHEEDAIKYKESIDCLVFTLKRNDLVVSIEKINVFYNGNKRRK